jgi:hypothetical protein
MARVADLERRGREMTMKYSEAALLDDVPFGEAEYQEMIAQALAAKADEEREQAARIQENAARHQQWLAEHPPRVTTQKEVDEIIRRASVNDNRRGPAGLDQAQTRTGNDRKTEPVPSPEAIAANMIWLGDRPIVPPRYLVEDTLPEVGLAVIGGQWFVGKTFVANDLSAGIIAGEAQFAGKQILRKGGVLWFAAEGQQQVEIRMKAALAKVGVEFERAPFVFVPQVPCLSDKGALASLRAYVAAAAKKMQERFGCELVLIVFDTLSASAGFKDENSAGETQRAMNDLSTLAADAKALVVAIDHYGKDVEVGVRGSSAKSGAADSILALLGERQATGGITNRRLVLVKERGRAVGQVVPFDLAPTLDGVTCTIAWRPGDEADAVDPTKVSVGLSILMRAFEDALNEAGVMEVPIAGMPQVRVVDREFVRARFNELYEPKGAGDPAHAKRAAFGRAAEKAKLSRAICVKERGGRTVFWRASRE